MKTKLRKGMVFTIREHLIDGSVPRYYKVVKVKTYKHEPPGGKVAYLPSVMFLCSNDPFNFPSEIPCL